MAVRLQRSPYGSHLVFVAGTNLYVRRHDDTGGDFTLDCNGHTATIAWLDASRLADLRFARRAELIHVLDAHVAVSPPPATDMTRARLRKAGDGLYHSSCGVFAVQRVADDDPDGFGGRWRVLYRRTDRHYESFVDYAPTLPCAEMIIASCARLHATSQDGR